MLPSAPEYVSLKTLRLFPHDHRLQVEAVFSEAPAYRLLRIDHGRQLVLELPEASLPAALPPAASWPLLRSVGYERGEHGPRLVFSSMAACQYEELSLIASAEGQDQRAAF